jgi:cyanophycin synthetase
MCGLVGAKRTRLIEEVRDDFLAIDTALDHLKTGDLCLVLVDQVEQVLAHLAQPVAAG